MLWARMVAYVTGTVNQELLLRNEYLGAENRILRAQIKGRLLLSEGEKATLADQWRLEKAKLAGLQDQLDRLRGRPWRPAMAKGEPPRNVDKSALIQTENYPVLHASLSAALERHVPG